MENDLSRDAGQSLVVHPTEQTGVAPLGRAVVDQEHVAFQGDDDGAARQLDAVVGDGRRGHDGSSEHQAHPRKTGELLGPSLLVTAKTVKWKKGKKEKWKKVPKWKQKIENDAHEQNLPNKKIGIMFEIMEHLTWNMQTFENETCYKIGN